MKTLKRVLTLPIPLYLNIFIVIVFIGILSYFIAGNNKSAPALSTPKDEASVMGMCDMHIVRNNNYQFIHPILLADLPDESSRLLPLKSQLMTLIDQQKSQGMITNASVYFKEFQEGGWFAVNRDEPYNPGSLVKIAIMMAYVKESEEQPGLMDKKIYFDPKFFNEIPHQTYEVNALQPGKYYTISELLHRMVEDSDNYSTGLLNKNVNLEIFKKIYADLDQPVPDVHDIKYQTNVYDYSKFLTVLYNGSYLKKTNSDM